MLRTIHLVHAHLMTNFPSSPANIRIYYIYFIHYVSFICNIKFTYSTFLAHFRPIFPFLYPLKTPRNQVVRIWSYSSPHFPAFGLNTERFGVSLRIQSECGKIRTRIIPNTNTLIFWCFQGV